MSDFEIKPNPTGCVKKNVCMGVVAVLLLVMVAVVLRDREVEIELERGPFSGVDANITIIILSTCISL